MLHKWLRAWSIRLQGQLVLSLGQLILPKNSIVNAKVLSTSMWVGLTCAKKWRCWRYFSSVSPCSWAKVSINNRVTLHDISAVWACWVSTGDSLSGWVGTRGMGWAGVDGVLGHWVVVADADGGSMCMVSLDTEEANSEALELEEKS